MSAVSSVNPEKSQLPLPTRKEKKTEKSSAYNGMIYKQKDPRKNGLPVLDRMGTAFQNNLNRTNEIPSNIQRRRIPPIGWCDTIIFKNGMIKSVHGSGELFNDSEILEKLEIVKRVVIKRFIDSNLYAEYTRHGKAIIQQQGTRGCTAATAAMLIMDNGKQPDIQQLRIRNLGNDEDQIRDIENAGLIPLTNHAATLSELRDLLSRHGSAIASVHDQLGGHVVVVDEISEDLSQVRLRDPYHGWEITVKSEAFFKEWQGGEVIQVSV